MCWSAQVSLNTFLLSVFAVLLALLNGYELKFAIFVMSYALMQLIEYFIWSRGLKSKTANKMLSLLGGALLLLQPLAAIFLLDDGPVRRFLLGVYALFILLNILFSKKTNIPRTTVASNGHLQWHFISESVFTPVLFLYLIMMITPFVLVRKYHYVLYFGIVTLLVSLFTYAQSMTWASMWCWMLNFLSVILIIRIVFWDHFLQYCTRKITR